MNLGFYLHRKENERRAYVEHRSEPERIILECGGCGERLILLGTEDDWRSRRAVFKCVCGKKLTLDEGADKEVLAAK